MHAIDSPSSSSSLLRSDTLSLFIPELCSITRGNQARLLLIKTWRIILRTSIDSDSMSKFLGASMRRIQKQASVTFGILILASARIIITVWVSVQNCWGGNGFICSQDWFMFSWRVFPSNSDLPVQTQRTRTYSSKQQFSLILEREPRNFAKKSATGKLYRLYCLANTWNPKRPEMNGGFPKQQFLRDSSQPDHYHRV